MTPPLERRTSAIGHAKQAQAGVESLARRPQVLEQPVGSWGIPDLTLSFGATQTPGDGWYPVPWADFATPHYSYGPTAPFDIAPHDDLGNSLFTLDITDDGDPNPGNDRYEVSTEREGFWASQMITAWDQVGTAGDYDIASVAQRIYWTSNSGIAFSPVDWRSSADWMIAGATSAEIDSFGFLDDGMLVTTIMPHYLPSNKTWQAAGIHRTGLAVERGLSGIMWKFWFIGEDDLDAWTFGNVFD